MCVCAFVCVCVCVYVYVHVCMHACMCVHRHFNQSQLGLKQHQLNPYIIQVKWVAFSSGHMGHQVK